jgi:hypothetical protein
MKKFQIFCILLLSNIFYGQIPKGSIQDKYYTCCSENLNRLEKIPSYPNFNSDELCSIKKCFRGISYPEINEIIYKRIIELAKINFKNNVLLYLVEGKGSVKFAEQQNEDIKDDNQFIYISVDDFVDAKEISKGRRLYNAQTKKLLRKRKKRTPDAR